MKELSIEQKAKAYDEALKKLKILHDDWATTQNRAAKEVEEIFHELKESEDDRIRKDIISYLKSSTVVFPKTWFAWLEKQGEQKPVISDDALREGISHFGITQYQIDNWLKKYVDIEKQGEQSIYNVPSREAILAIWELGNEWKELTNGVCSTEYGTQLDYIQKHWEESEYYLREKQSEQPRYSIGDVLCDKSCTTLNKATQPNFKIVDIKNGMYICDKGSFPVSQQDEYELVAKKLEPKFKAGDIIRLKNGDGLVWTVKEVHKDNCYTIVCDDKVDFIQFDDEWELVEQVDYDNESGDKKIRKHLITLFKDKYGKSSNVRFAGIKVRDIICWLETQDAAIGKEKVLIGVRKDIALSIMDFLDRNTLGVCLSGMEREDLESAVVNSDWSKVYDYMKKKLEKQSEQKPYGQRKECEDCQFNYAGECKGYCDLKRNDQKPVDKVEAKFHEGDWIVHQGTENIYQAVAVIDNQYQLKYGDNYTVQNCADVDRCARLWDITKDANDGDVLVASDSSIFLFAGVVGCACKHYVALTTYGDVKFNEGLKHYWENSSAVHPATKEQCDLIVQKIKEAGYEWNAEKKELKKLEDEVHNGEDYGIDGLYHAQRILEKTLGCVDGYQSDDGILEHKCAITAIKNLYKQTPAEWSKEDKKKLSRIYTLLAEAADEHAFSTTCRLIGDKECVELQDFLKSLKPKKHWKPSEEQMNDLKIVIDSFTFEPDSLKELYENLKQL